MDRRLVAEAYDRTSVGFATAADQFVYRHLARPLVDALNSIDGPVLDVAAGAGAAGRHFTHVVALDISMGQLHQNTVGPRVQADAERLPFRTDSFAAAVCVFGINHVPNPQTAVGEMARVAPLVGVTTWARPENPYAPKQVVLDALERHAGRARTPAGAVVDSLSNRVGSVGAVTSFMSDVGLAPRVREVTIVVPWPGIDSYLDYRLTMASTAGLVADATAIRQEAAADLATIPENELDWHAKLIVGIGARHCGTSANS